MSFLRLIVGMVLVALIIWAISEFRKYRMQGLDRLEQVRFDEEQMEVEEEITLREKELERRQKDLDNLKDDV